MDGLITEEEHKIVAKAAFECSLKWLDELKSSQVPIPYGKSQYFKSLCPTADLQELATSDCPYWSGYAAVMMEYVELFNSIPKQQFVDKKKK